jgi:hypothetical protein
MVETLILMSMQERIRSEACGMMGSCGFGTVETALVVRVQDVSFSYNSVSLCILNKENNLELC